MLQCLGLITPHPVLDNLGCPRHQLALDLRLEGRKNQPPAVQKESLSQQRPHFSCFSFLWGFHVVAILRFLIFGDLRFTTARSDADRIS